MQIIKDLEKFLSGVLKGLPPLPENFRKWIADNIWILTIISVVLSVISGLLLLTGAIFVSAVVSPAYVNSLYAQEVTSVSHFVIFAWIALIALAVNVFILLKSIPHLKTKARAGWDLLFLAEVLWFIYGVFNWLQYTRDISSLFGSLIGALIGFYVLFQIQDKFSAKSSSPVAK